MFNKRLLDLYEPIEISGSFTDMIICHIEQLHVIYNKRIFNWVTIIFEGRKGLWVVFWHGSSAENKANHGSPICYMCSRYNIR